MSRLTMAEASVSYPEAMVLFDVQVVPGLDGRDNVRLRDDQDENGEAMLVCYASIRDDSVPHRVEKRWTFWEWDGASWRQSTRGQ